MTSSCMVWQFGPPKISRAMMQRPSSMPTFAVQWARHETSYHLRWICWCHPLMRLCKRRKHLGTKDSWNCAWCSVRLKKTIHALFNAPSSDLQWPHQGHQQFSPTQRRPSPFLSQRQGNLRFLCHVEFPLILNSGPCFPSPDRHAHLSTQYDLHRDQKCKFQIRQCGFALPHWLRLWCQPLSLSNTHKCHTKQLHKQLIWMSHQSTNTERHQAFTLNHSTNGDPTCHTCISSTHIIDNPDITWRAATIQKTWKYAPQWV